MNLVIKLILLIYFTCSVSSDTNDHCSETEPCKDAYEYCNTYKQHCECVNGDNYQFGSTCSAISVVQLIIALVFSIIVLIFSCVCVAVLIYRRRRRNEGVIVANTQNVAVQYSRPTETVVIMLQGVQDPTVLSPPLQNWTNVTPPNYQLPAYNDDVHYQKSSPAPHKY